NKLVEFVGNRPLQMSGKAVIILTCVFGPSSMCSYDEPSAPAGPLPRSPGRSMRGARPNREKSWLG
ncbi:hypothetical protein Q4O60_19260, partial [Aeribacillus pallidus]|nr:hypothetical protein [Aeribacillus pallidus]